MSDPDCIFCKIAAKQIPSTIVHEDELVVAFRDISPQVPTHVLIVPKVHVAGLDAIGPEHKDLVGHIALVGQKLAKDLGIAERGYRLVANCGPDAGQTVFHLHFHLLGGAPMAGKMV
ncbi:MAG TPA: histidine triad nucleotide-binding protein [Holophaga sp.]|jgi:histidine triad (HIT) family protein|nr:histidine triad nucleotide-binding protein [Holophaga sp.]